MDREDEVVYEVIEITLGNLLRGPPGASRLGEHNKELFGELILSRRNGGASGTLKHS